MIVDKIALTTFALSLWGRLRRAGLHRDRWGHRWGLLLEAQAQFLFQLDQLPPVVVEQLVLLQDLPPVIRQLQIVNETLSHRPIVEKGKLVGFTLFLSSTICFLWMKMSCRFCWTTRSIRMVGGGPPAMLLLLALQAARMKAVGELGIVAVPEGLGKSDSDQSESWSSMSREKGLLGVG